MTPTLGWNLNCSQSIQINWDTQLPCDSTDRCKFKHNCNFQGFKNPRCEKHTSFGKKSKFMFKSKHHLLPLPIANHFKPNNLVYTLVQLEIFWEISTNIYNLLDLHRVKSPFWLMARDYGMKSQILLNCLRPLQFLDVISKRD